VNCHGNVELSAGVPHEIKTSIINSNQRARVDVLKKTESQCFEGLQPASPIPMGTLDRVCL
jgi:hypothetical protein